jgi:hypothetical protein
MVMNRILRISSKLYGDTIHSELKDEGGVYRIFSKKNDRIKPVNRLLDRDDDGTLYIGMAKNFTDRAIELKKSLPEYTGSNHDFGLRYQSNDRIKKEIEYENLFVELIPSPSPRQLEIGMFKTYLQKFGELPPFNRVS